VLERFRAAFETPFGVVMTRNGRIDQLATRPELNELAYNILRTVLSALQFVPPGTKKWDEWTSEETDHNGTYVARYRQVEHGKFVKTKLEYSRMTAFEGAILSRPDRKPAVSAEHTMTLDDLGIIGRVDARESVAVPFGETSLKASSTVGLTLKSIRAGSRAAIDLGALSTAPLDRPKSGPPLEQAMERRARELVGGRTLQALMRELEEIEPANLRDQGWATVKRIAASLTLEPSGADEVVRRLRHEEDTGDRELLLAALSKAGTDEAREALMEVASDESFRAEARTAALAHLGMDERPSEDTVERLHHLADHAPDPASRRQAVLALGAAARQGQEQGTATQASAEAVAALGRVVSSSSSVEEQLAALAALGNAGSADSLPTLHAALRSPDVRVRAGAMEALRFIKSDSVDQTIVTFMLGDPESAVRRAAIFASGYRDMTPVLVGGLTKAAQMDPDDSLRVKALAELARALEGFPEVKAVFEWSAKNDPSADVRKTAAAELARHP
jgi:HEAT repeat protein